MEYFSLRHGKSSDWILWDMDFARAMQLMYCESIKNGNVMSYPVIVEDNKTNEKLEQLERNLEKWLSEQL